MQGGKWAVFPVLQLGDGLDLHLGVLGQAGRLDGGAGGEGLLKNWAYTSFMAAKSFMSARNTVVLTTAPMLVPAALRMAFRLFRDCWAWA